MREELLDRLDVVRLEPTVVVDLRAPARGTATIALKRRYPRSRVVRARSRDGHVAARRARRQTLLRRFDRVAPTRPRCRSSPAVVDMVFSSLMLQWCNDPDEVFREMRRVLRPGGLLTFATLGPDTLCELRRAWQAADPGHAHVNRFIDMHDLGDALRAGGLRRTGDGRRALHADL